MLSDRNELTFRVNMLFRQMGDSDKTNPAAAAIKHHHYNGDWNDNNTSYATSSSGLAHSNASWEAGHSSAAFANYSAAAATSLPQAQRYPAITSHPVTSAAPAYPSVASYQPTWYDFNQQQQQQQHAEMASQQQGSANHCMSAPTTPMNEDEPPHLGYIQGQQHPYAMTPTYATLTGRRDHRNHDTLHHQSPEQYDEYDRPVPSFPSWDQSYPAPAIDSHSPGSHEDNYYPGHDDDYRKPSASGMPVFNTSPTGGAYQYSPGDETPSPMANSYPAGANTDYLSYHDDNAKHARRYSIGGGMITSAPLNMPSYPPYMKAYHYKVPLTERPYKCDKCPQSFNRNHDLKRHKRIHLSVKPFPCQTCDKQFSRKDALKRHILVKRCGQPLPPDGRRSSNHHSVSQSTSGVSNSRNKSGPLDLPDQYANAPMAPPY
ncbi:hypothetical protein VKS41_002106 [Umbelopsis sp. WA50703]|jgi:uncharacterized CHY-type Zn-finger protein